MARECKVCALNKEDKQHLERELIRGVSKTSLSKKYNVPVYSVDYHEKHHITRQMASACEKKSQMAGLDVMKELQTLMDLTQNVLDTATEKNQNALALAAIREMRNHLTLVSNIQAWMIQHQDGGQQLTNEQLHQQKVNDETDKTIAENMDYLSEEEKECYLALMMKLMSGDDNKIPRIRYNPIVHITARKPMKRTKPPQYTTQAEKPQEIAPISPLVKDKEVYLGVQEIKGTEIGVGYRRDTRR